VIERGVAAGTFGRYMEKPGLRAITTRVRSMTLWSLIVKSFGTPACRAAAIRAGGPFRTEHAGDRHGDDPLRANARRSHVACMLDIVPEQVQRLERRCSSVGRPRVGTEFMAGTLSGTSRATFWSGSTAMGPLPGDPALGDT
jgi:hypothetical protein